MTRVGIGQDSHRFSKKKCSLKLGGITIDFDKGFVAQSDGDVILHSLCNALSSAIGGDSISTWFDEHVKKGECSSAFAVEVIMNRLNSLNFYILNVSISVEAKIPYLDLPTINRIKENIAKLLLVDSTQVGITFTSGEGLTAFGKGLGMQAITMVLIDDKS